MRRVGRGYTQAMAKRESGKSADDARVVLTVSDLNREARQLLERGFARIWVEGEVSNLARPASGHMYFSLKDDGAQIRGAWFRQRQRQRVAVDLANGDRILACGRVSIYEPRGDYQLIVEQVETAGEGALLKQFEALKQRLAAEGLFDEARKKKLPELPRAIGVVTSPSGAAIRDILSVLGRRFPAVPVIVYPAAVQGETAAAELVAALGRAVERAECDLLIIGRGGGSLEDLQAFNDETLARAVFDCPIPVISAVGHEVDFSIADFVADARAPTPSGAAELAVPDQAEWLRGLALSRQRLVSAASRVLQDRSQAVDWLARRLGRASPAARVEQRLERLAQLRKSLTAALGTLIASRSRRLERNAGRLLAGSPAGRIERLQNRVGAAEARMSNAILRRLERSANRLAVAGRALDAVSPLATLARGYAIVSDASTGSVLIDSDSAKAGDEIVARLARGSLIATVTESLEDET